jgi:hypothetical protein
MTNNLTISDSEKNLEIKCKYLEQRLKAKENEIKRSSSNIRQLREELNLAVHKNAQLWKDLQNAHKNGKSELIHQTELFFG